jgi:hypothetical protein
MMTIQKRRHALAGIIGVLTLTFLGYAFLSYSWRAAPASEQMAIGSSLTDPDAYISAYRAILATPVAQALKSVDVDPYDTEYGQ